LISFDLPFQYASVFFLLSALPVVINRGFSAVNRPNAAEEDSYQNDRVAVFQCSEWIGTWKQPASSVSWAARELTSPGAGLSIPMAGSIGHAALGTKPTGKPDRSATVAMKMSF
jgi:hypothetical protein